jgi:hypothetical protein
LGTRAFFLPPLPLWERVAPNEVRRRVRGILRLNELCENGLQNAHRLLQYIIVPVTCDLEPFCYQDGFSRLITLGRRVLTTIDFNDEALLEANEIENIALERHLPAEFEKLQPSIAQQSPHGGFGVRRLMAHLLCEIADALRCRTMTWRLRHVPLTRRRTAFGATLSHKGRGKIQAPLAENSPTPASASARRARPWNPCPAPAWASRDRPVAAPRRHPRFEPRYPANSAN